MDDSSILLMAGTVLGGLGLFMLGVSMITDGLKFAAGGALRDLLARSTRTPWHGMASGLFFTALVQSSSAVTIATIGFVNAGLLRMAAALSIVLGATIGTTMTGWLVSAVGFQIKISAFALPMLGLGMLMRLLAPSRRSGAVGEALAGFGLFFLGIDFLRDAFEGVAASLDMAALAPGGVAGALLFTIIGLVMTVLTQSSSAAVAIILTANAGGLVGFAEAAAAIIGATVGTTSTSALAVIGATSRARRVAAGHVLINSFNGLIGLLLLPVLLWLAGRHADLLAPPVMLAVFHSSFNVVGVLLLRPFIPRLSKLLEKRFRSPLEDWGRPRYLDQNIIASPSLALDAFLMELRRMARLSRRHTIEALTGDRIPDHILRQQHDGIRQLVLEIEHFVARLETARLHKSVTEHLPLVLRIANYLDEATALAQEAAEQDRDVELLLDTELRDDILAYQRDVLALLRRCDIDRADFEAEALEAEYQQLRETWRALKTALLEAGVNRRVPVVRLNPAIEKLRFMLRVAERSSKVAMRLAQLSTAVPRRASRKA